MKRQAAAAITGTLCIALVCCFTLWGSGKNQSRSVSLESEQFKVAASNVIDNRTGLGDHWDDDIKQVQEAYEAQVAAIRLATSANMRKVGHTLPP